MAKQNKQTEKQYYPNTMGYNVTHGKDNGLIRDPERFLAPAPIKSEDGLPTYGELLKILYGMQSTHVGGGAGKQVSDAMDGLVLSSGLDLWNITKKIDQAYGGDWQKRLNEIGNMVDELLREMSKYSADLAQFANENFDE